MFSDWPPHVEAHLELSAPCGGCSKCIAPPTKPTQVKPAKNVWWWPTDNRMKQIPQYKPDPRLQVHRAASFDNIFRQIILAKSHRLALQQSMGGAVVKHSDTKIMIFLSKM